MTEPTDNELFRVDGVACFIVGEVHRAGADSIKAKDIVKRLIVNVIQIRISELSELLKDSCATENRCRALLKDYDKSDSFGVIPLDEVVIAAFASRDTEIREVLEGLSTMLRYTYGLPERCWCRDPHSNWTHTPACLAAKKLWSEVQA